MRCAGRQLRDSCRHARFRPARAGLPTSGWWPSPTLLRKAHASRRATVVMLVSRPLLEGETGVVSPQASQTVDHRVGNDLIATLIKMNIANDEIP